MLRRAARIAERTESAELFAVHVLRGDGLAGAPVGALAALRRLAEDVGASFHTVVSDDVPTALLDFARGVDATQLVIGTSRRSRAARLLVESIGGRVVQDSGHIDVHMVTHAEAGRGIRLPRRFSAVPAGRRAAGWALGLLLPLAAVAIGILGRDVLGLSTDVVLFFLATVISALVGGLGPALLAAVAGALLLNFFLTPPLYTFTIAERENVITLVAMVLVAVLVALVVDRAARRAQQAAQARAEAALLASFSRTVLTRADPLPRLLDKIREAFTLSTVAILERRDGRWTVSACAGPPDCTRPEQADVDVAVDPDTHLVGRGRTLAAAERRLLDAVAGQAMLALRNQQIAAEAAQARRRADATELRTALLSAVGHDLRTPLASIKAAAGSLRDERLRLSEHDRAELAATVEESADRLTGLVENLLDSSRLATGAVTPHLQPVGFDEVAPLALRGLDGAERVRLEIDERAPEVLADPGLLERVVANVVDNALRHGRGAPVVLRASSLRRSSSSCGSSTPAPACRADEADRLFSPFQRLGDRDPRGLGLGLSVARGFTEAMGGTLTAEDTPGGGLTVVVSLPAAPRSRRAGPGQSRDPSPSRRRRPAAPPGAADQPDRARLRRRHRRRRGDRPARRGRPGARGRRPRPRAARPRRHRRHRRAPPLHRGADRRAVRAHRLGGQGGCPGPRRRRLRDQAVRGRRAGGAAAGRGPPGGRDGGPHRRVDAGDLSIDLADRVVSRAGEPVRLTPTEWSILELLVQHQGRLVGRQELLRHIWGPAERKETSYLRVYLAQLRRKLEADPAHPEHLITEAGLGYRFRP